MTAELRAIGLAALVSLTLPAATAAQTGVAVWRKGELDRRDAALSTRVGPDRSARETLADYGNHRFRFLYRDADGVPEQHDRIIDVVMVHSGQGALLVGGELLDPTGDPATGEYRGSAIQGGERYELGPGDVVHIPAGLPHSFLVPDGEHLTYVLVKFPAPMP